MGDIKKYIPAILIGAVVVYLIYKLSSNQPPTQIINRAVPVATTSAVVDTRDPYRAQAFGQLASFAAVSGGQQTQLQLAGLQVGAEQNRLQNAYQLAQVQAANALQIAQGSQGIEAQRIAAQRDIAASAQQAATETARILGEQRAYDRQAQLDAQNRVLDAVSRSQTIGATTGLLNSILGAIGRSQSASRQTGGGLPTQPAQQRTIFRYPPIPRPNIGPYTPPFIPGEPVYNPSNIFDLTDAYPPFTGDFGTGLGLPESSLPNVNFGDYYPNLGGLSSGSIPDYPIGGDSGFFGGYDPFADYGY